MNTNTEILKTLRAQESDTEIEIDLRVLFYEIMKRIWVVLLVTILAADLAFIYTKFLVTPMYTSTSTMIVLTKETTLSSLADLQMGSQLTNDYEILIKTDTVLDSVIEDLSLDMKKDELKEAITISNPQDSRVLEISVKDSDPKRAAKIVNTLSVAAAEYIGDMMEVAPPKIAEKGKIPQERTSPSYSRNILVGALLGFLLAIGVIAAGVILNDSIQTEEDIERYLGLPVLATVPEKTAEKRNKSQNKKKDKNRKTSYKANKRENSRERR